MPLWSSAHPGQPQQLCPLQVACFFARRMHMCCVEAPGPSSAAKKVARRAEHALWLLLPTQGAEDVVQGGENAEAEAAGDAVELEVLGEEKAGALEQLLRLLRLDSERHTGGPGQGGLGGVCREGSVLLLDCRLPGLPGAVRQFLCLQQRAPLGQQL